MPSPPDTRTPDTPPLREVPTPQSTSSVFWGAFRVAARPYVAALLDALEHGGPMGFLDNLEPPERPTRDRLWDQAQRLRERLNPDNEWDNP